MESNDNQDGIKPDQEVKALDVFLNAVDKDGGISYRSKYGRHLREIENQLTADPEGTALALLRSDIGHLAIIKRAILEHLLNNPSTVITDEGLHPILKNDYVKIVDALRRSLTLLRTIEGPAKGKGKEKKAGDTLSEAIFDGGGDE